MTLTVLLIARRLAAQHDLRANRSFAENSGVAVFQKVAILTTLRRNADRRHRTVGRTSLIAVILSGGAEPGPPDLCITSPFIASAPHLRIFEAENRTRCLGLTTDLIGATREGQRLDAKLENMILTGCPLFLANRQYGMVTREGRRR